MRFVVVSLLACLLLSVPAMAQTQPSIENYDVVLLPVFSSGPGAHGSQWETTISLATTTEQAVKFPVPLFAASPTDRCNGTPFEDNLFPYQVQSVCPQFESPTGLLLYVPKTLDPLEFHGRTRVRDLSRQASSAGFEIPIVREGDFRKGPFLLLDIPSDPRFRANLRIYAGLLTGFHLRVIDTGNVPVSIEIYDSRDLGVLLASTQLTMSKPQVAAGNPFFVHPGYLSIGDLVATFPALATVPNYTIRLVVPQPLTSPVVEDSAWAFVTVTNNETQEVTVVTP
jgi:hypothetical protein